MLDEEIEAQIKHQGVACYKATDGEVFVFTSATLKQLLERASESESGRVILFIKTKTEETTVVN